MAAEPVEDIFIDLVDMEFINDTLYFIADKDENLESDYFGKLNPKYSIIRNVDNKVLIVNQSKQPRFEDMADNELQENKPQIRFIMYLYKDSNVRGLAVSFSVYSKKMYTLSCKDKIISFKEMNPPDNINEDKSDIIFFQKLVKGHNKKMKFESSLYKGCFLACKREGDRFKLVLKDPNEELPIDSVMFILEDEN
ncbi:interleukin-18 [Erinaceus europaeus]|uniref:Interleukin-18 n=1 Tax=Erinaceus europaeus TaxID=9365 RepID=A0A1S3AKQ4_ERIEU|nr:interleukin-18 [Erinaceus europaeus]